MSRPNIPARFNTVIQHTKVNAGRATSLLGKSRCELINTLHFIIPLVSGKAKTCNTSVRRWHDSSETNGKYTS